MTNFSWSLNWDDEHVFVKKTNKYNPSDGADTIEIFEWAISISAANKYGKPKKIFNPFTYVEIIVFTLP